MRGSAQLLVSHLRRALSTSSGACKASVGPTGTFPAWLGPSASTRVSTPLTKALPGTHQKNGYAVPLEPPPTKVTTLPNGVRIVSEATT
ncbi:hypothetical protein MNEG_13019, partial [Monoraphidium neglectum]